MPELDYTARELRLRFAIFGPVGAGKRTLLRQLHAALPAAERGNFAEAQVGAAELLSFDFTPIDLLPVAEYRPRATVMTLIAPVSDSAAYARSCADLDAMLFVADSRAARAGENSATLRQLGAHRFLREVPVVFFYNHRDAAEALTLEELEAQLNPLQAAHSAGIATAGDGLNEVLPALIRAAMANAG